MRHTFILAANTFREAIRDRILTTVLVFGGALVLGSVALAPLTLGEESRVIRDLGLAAINLFALLLIVMAGTGMVYREIEHRTIYTILTLPVKRGEFIVGKFLGLYATILMSIGILSVLYLIVVAVYGGGLHGNVFLALGMTVLECAVITAIAIFFSSVASPFLSAAFTFFVYVAGHMANELRLLASQHGNAALQGAANVMYWVLPSLHHFDVRNNLLSGVPITAGHAAYCVAYTVLFSAALLLLTVVAFKRRDFE